MAESRSLSPEALLQHASFVRSLARTLVRDPAGVQDLTQDVWLAALERPPRRLDNVRGWLVAVARNLARLRHRTERRRQRHESVAARTDRVYRPDEAVARLEWDRRIVDAVLALEDPYRATVVHRYFDGLRPPEIANRMGVPRQTVYTRLRRALAQLRTRFDSEAGSRSAWCGALLPLIRVPPTTEALAGAGTSGAAIVSTKTTAVAATVLVAGSFLAGWALRAESAPGDTARNTSRETARDHLLAQAALRRERETERSERERLQRELDEAQRRGSTVAEIGADAKTAENKLEGPRFVYDGTAAYDDSVPTVHLASEGRRASALSDRPRRDRGGAAGAIGRGSRQVACAHGRAGRKTAPAGRGARPLSHRRMTGVPRR